MGKKSTRTAGAKKARAPHPAESAAVGSSNLGRKSPAEKTLILILAIVIGYAHRSHVSTLFENDKHFSHLSNLEREMSFRTEMGLYYSYFKSLIEAPTFMNGLERLYANNKTEYPDTINTLKRFNLYPEVFLGSMFRGFTQMAESMKWNVKQCYRINRGENMSAVQSCDGLGDPMIFYVNCVWIFAAFNTVFLFLLSTEISNSIVGGFISVVCYFYNHSEATRVMWTPSLRESFAFPVCVAQMLLVTMALRDPTLNAFKSLVIASCSCAFILIWQFAQFSLFTQLCAVYAIYVLRIVGRNTFKTILYGQLVGLIVAAGLLFGNEMLLTSWLSSCIISALILSHIPDQLLASLNVWIRIPVHGLLLPLTTFLVKVGFSKVFQLQDDAHIFDILRSKFSDYRDFHTLLYTCAKEFDFLGWEMPWKTTLTLLLPTVLLVVALVLILALKDTLYRPDTSSKEAHLAMDPCVAYNLLQLICFAGLAVIIMRLKLFFTPQLCIMAGLIASPKILSLIRLDRREVQLSFLVALIAGMSYQGISNIQHQRQIMGEYSNYPLEELIEWVNENIPETASMAGSMPLMANLLLSTRRPVINHPHYEDVGLRKRTRQVYEMYSRNSVDQVHQTMVGLQARYLVLTRAYCLNGVMGGCGMTDIWDVEHPDMKDHPEVCPHLFRDAYPKPFTRVFANQEYVVLKVD